MAGRNGLSLQGDEITPRTIRAAAQGLCRGTVVCADCYASAEKVLRALAEHQWNSTLDLMLEGRKLSGVYAL